MLLLKLAYTNIHNIKMSLLKQYDNTFAFQQNFLVKIVIQKLMHQIRYIFKMKWLIYLSSKKNSSEMKVLSTLIKPQLPRRLFSFPIQPFKLHYFFNIIINLLFYLVIINFKRLYFETEYHCIRFDS